MPRIRNPIDHFDRLFSSSTIRSKERGLAITFAFYSPKNGQKMVVNGISAYCHTLLCEGNNQISGFRPTTLRELCENRVRQAADIFYRNGKIETWVFSSGPPKKESIRFVEPTTEFYWKHTEELRGKSTLLVNWIRLRAFMSAARGLSITRERTVIHGEIASRECTTLGNLIDIVEIDPGLMLSAIAGELARGEIVTELETAPLTRSTVLRRPT